MKSIQTQEIYSVMKNVVGQEECSKHNQVYNLIETPGGIVGSCPDCFNEQIENEDQQLVKQANENRKGWQVPFIEKHERISSDLKEARVSTYKPTHETQEKAKRMVIDYIKSFDKESSLVLSGKSGNGKSHLAYAITKAIRQQGHKAWFIKTRDLLALRNKQFEHGSDITEDKILKVIESIELLVLDDVGSEYQKANESGNETWVSDFLYAVFDARLNKATVSTTNYTNTELEKKYGYNGERIVSRMVDNAKGIRLQGEDHRKKNIF